MAKIGFVIPFQPLARFQNTNTNNILSKIQESFDFTVFPRNHCALKKYVPKLLYFCSAVHLLQISTVDSHDWKCS